ncbi:hypothetical protein AKJ16_DCAP27723 [Drosera capensis]
MLVIVVNTLIYSFQNSISMYVKTLPLHCDSSLYLAILCLRSPLCVIRSISIPAVVADN